MSDHYLTKQHQDSIIKVLHQMNIDIPQTTTSDSFSDHFQELYETLNILSGGIVTLNDDGQRLSHESLQCQIKFQTLVKDFSQLKLAVEETHSFLEGVKPNQDILNQYVASLKQEIDDMRFVSYDGTFVWRITNFREKMSK